MRLLIRFRGQKMLNVGNVVNLVVLLGFYSLFLVAFFLLAYPSSICGSLFLLKIASSSACRQPRSRTSPLNGFWTTPCSRPPNQHQWWRGSRQVQVQVNLTCAPWAWLKRWPCSTDWLSLRLGSPNSEGTLDTAGTTPATKPSPSPLEIWSR